MNRATAIIIIAMVTVTFACLAVFVGIKAYLRFRTERIEAAVERIDELIAKGEFVEAERLILDTERKALTLELRESLSSQKDKIQDDLVRIRREDEERRQRVAENQRKQHAERSQREQATRQRRLQDAQRIRAEKSANLQAVGGAVGGIFAAIMTFIAGCIVAGLGQLIIAFRDIAINSYLSVGTESRATQRTPVPLGKHSPPYAFIPFVALVFYLCAGVMFLIASGLLVFVLVNL